MANNICIGTAQFGMQYGIANHAGQPQFDEVLRIVALARENDICYYDTAQSYGECENILGQAFSKLSITEGLRCISKLKPDLKNDSKSIINSVKESVEKLELNSLWALMSHRVEQVNNEAIRTAVKLLKSDELIKYWGVSIYRPEDALQMLRNENVDIIQVPFNILDRRLLDIEFFDLAKIYNKIIFIRSVFLQGLIFLSSTQLHQKGMSWAVPYMLDVNRLIGNYNVPTEVLAIQAVRSVNPDAVMITGVEKVAQLKQNLSILNNRRISPDQVKSWWQDLPVYPEKMLNPSLW